MNRTARLWWGGGLAALGVVCWALALAILEPAVRDGSDTIAEVWRTRTPGVPVRIPGADEVSQMVLWPKDLRWGAMVLALGGLLIAVTARTAFVLAMPLWLGLDIVVDRAEVGGWQAFAALVGVVGGFLVAGVWAARRFTRDWPPEPGGPGILVYCGVAAALSPLMFNVDPTTKAFRPQAVMLVAVLVSLGLALGAVLAALTATAPTRGCDQEVNRALTFALAVAVPAIAAQWWFADVDYPGTWVMALPWAAAPVLLVGCAILAKGWPSTALGWIGTGLQATVVSGMSFALIWFGLVLSFLVRAEYLRWSGVGFADGYQIIIGGLVAGPLIGAVAMLGGWQRPSPV